MQIHSVWNIEKGKFKKCQRKWETSGDEKLIFPKNIKWIVCVSSKTSWKMSIIKNAQNLALRYIYLKDKVKGMMGKTERRERELPAIGAYSKCLPQFGVGPSPSQDRKHNLGLPHGQEPKVWTVTCCLPRCSIRKLIQKQSQDSSRHFKRGCRHAKWQPNVLPMPTPKLPLIPCLYELLEVPLY